RVRIFICRIGAPLPLVQIRESVAIRVLVENVRVLDGQTKFFEPVVRNRWMHLRVLQCCGEAVGANEMFFRNKKPGAGTGLPLGWMLKLLRGAVQLLSCRRWRGIFRRARGLTRHQTIPELDSAPPNGESRNKKEDRRGDNHDAIVV